MRIHTIEDNFDYQFKKVIKALKEDFPELADLPTDELQEAVWGNAAMCVSFTHRMLETACEYGGDEMFETE